MERYAKVDIWDYCLDKNLVADKFCLAASGLGLYLYMDMKVDSPDSTVNNIIFKHG